MDKTNLSRLLPFTWQWSIFKMNWNWMCCIIKLQGFVNMKDGSVLGWIYWIRNCLCNSSLNCETIIDWSALLLDKLYVRKELSFHHLNKTAAHQHYEEILTTAPEPDVAMAGGGGVTWSGYPLLPSQGEAVGLLVWSGCPFPCPSPDRTRTGNTLPTSPVDRQTPVKTLPSLVLRTRSVTRL